MYSLKKLVREIMEKIGSVTMGTSATTITGAIAEHESDISNLNSKIGYDSLGTCATTSNPEADVTLTKKIGDYDAIIVIMAGTNNTARFFAYIPEVFLHSYQNNQQMNGYIDNQRVFAEVSIVDNYHLHVKLSSATAYVDRLIIYLKK